LSPPPFQKQTNERASNQTSKQTNKQTTGKQTAGAREQTNEIKLKNQQTKINKRK
jgi:hypothetical protein